MTAAKPDRRRKEITTKVWAAVERGKILCAGFKRPEIVRFANDRWERYAIWRGVLTLSPPPVRKGKRA